MNAENKLKLEKRILNLSMIGSIAFVLVEVVMAYITRSHSIVMDSIFDVAETLMVGPFLLLVPLLYRPVTERRPYVFSQVESLFIVIKYSVLLVITPQLVIDNIQLILNGGHIIDAVQVAAFETVLFVGCLGMYGMISYFSRKYESVTIRAELFNWKLDVFGSLGVALAFFGQLVLQTTPFAKITPYIDPVVAVVMALSLVAEPIRMIGRGLRKLVLFAPKQEVMDEIRSIAERYMQTCAYDIRFLDVIQTGRKTWVEIYIDSPNDIITLKTLNRIRDGIRDELRKYFDQIYVELIPDLPE